MYLAVLLIIVALLVFYNEFNSKMNIAEYVLLFIALLAIIRASFYYIKFDTSIEGFTLQNKNKDKKVKYEDKKDKNKYEDKKDKNKDKKDKFKNKKVEYEYEDEDEDEDEDGANNEANNEAEDKDTMIINSNESTEYLDSDEIIPNKNNSNSFTSISTLDAKNENIKSTSSINQVNDLLGISSSFTDIPIPTKYDNDNNDDEIKSIFNPKVIIGKGSGNSNNENSNGFGSSGNSSSWNSAFSNDGFGFNNTMNPVNNLWRDNHSYYNSGNSNTGSCANNTNINNGISNDQWSQGMDAYNKGKWNRNQYTRPSDYVDYTSPSGYGTTTPNSSTSTIYGNTSSESLNSNTDTQPIPNSNNETNNKTNKKCGSYNDLDETQAGDLIVKEYTRAKDWVAGYTYVPPINWDVPQRHTPVCNTVTPNVHKLTGLIDRGLPINALELTRDGRIADTEDTVKLSNVGSMIPKFNYQEQPFSKPYV